MRCLPGLCVLVVLFSNAYKDDPEDSIEKGKRAIEKRDYENAIRHLTEAIKQDANNDEAYYARAFAYYSRKEYDKAIADYTEVVRRKKRLQACNRRLHGSHQFEERDPSILQQPRHRLSEDG
jgi:tetratricopeptide (TPR) repeat protein